MKQKITSPAVLGVVLREARKQKGMNQTEAGRLVGIEQPTISHVEHGRPGTRLDTLFRLLAALELELVIQPRGTRVESEEDW